MNHTKERICNNIRVYLVAFELFWQTPIVYPIYLSSREPYLKSYTVKIQGLVGYWTAPILRKRNTNRTEWLELHTQYVFVSSLKYLQLL